LPACSPDWSNRCRPDSGGDAMSRALAWSAIIVFLISVGSKLLGFVRDMAIAYFFGAGVENDAFNVAQIVPVSLLGTIAVSITTIYITMLQQTERTGGREAALRFSNQLLLFFFCFALFAAIAGHLFAPFLVALFAPGLSADGKTLAAEMARIGFYGFFLHFYISVATGYVNNHGRFYAATLKGVLMNVATIGAMLLGGGQLSIQGVMVSIFAGYLVHAIYLTVIMYRLGFRFQFEAALWRELAPLKRFLALLLPVALGVSVTQLQQVTDRILASFLVEGSISALSYAGRLTMFGGSLVAASVVTVFFPSFSKWAQSNQQEKIVEVTRTYIGILQGLMIPLSLWIWLDRDLLVKVVLERGAFTPEDTQMTADAVGYLAIGLLAFGIREMYVKIFHALQDTVTPVKNGVYTVTANVILSILLMGPLQIGGIALGTSLSLTLMTLLLHRELKRRWHQLALTLPWTQMGKVLICAALASTVMLSANLLTPSSDMLTLVIHVAVYGIVYLIASAVARLEWVRLVQTWLKRS